MKAWPAARQVVHVADLPCQLVRVAAMRAGPNAGQAIASFLAPTTAVELPQMKPRLRSRVETPPIMGLGTGNRPAMRARLGVGQSPIALTSPTATH